MKARHETAGSTIVVGSGFFYFVGYYGFLNPFGGFCSFLPAYMFKNALSNKLFNIFNEALAALCYVFVIIVVFTPLASITSIGMS